MRLPDIFIAGGQKCGTSTLHASLSCHKQIHSATDPGTGQAVKEVGFFCNRWQNGSDWYRSHFRHQFGMGLDATPNYLNDKVAQLRMAGLTPDAKIVVSLRDPVQRAYSQFNHYSQMVAESETWDWHLPGESLRANLNAELQLPIRPWYGMLGRGRYCDQLTHLFELYDRNQVHVMVMERWAAAPEQHFSAAVDFLGLPPQALPVRIMHVRDYTVEAMADPLFEQLRDYYRPLNAQLFDLLGESIVEWG